jgi:hypothetical protein
MNRFATRLAAILLGLLGAARAIAQPSSPAVRSAHRQALATYGVDFTSAYRVGFSEFSPADSTLTYTDESVLGTDGVGRYPTVPSIIAFMAVPHLPSGALVSGVELDLCDTNPTDDVGFFVASTDYKGEQPNVISGVTSSNINGCDYIVAPLPTPFEVDNVENQLVLLAYLPDTDGSMRIAGAIVYYKLQVAPAPASATFNDVPTSHPFFQYIEALAASGITGGCQTAPPKFCPNAPVTRGQMAVFLAKALGLTFE